MTNDSEKTFSIRSLGNKKVWFSKPKKNDPDAVKKLGKIHHWVFHPTEPRCVGFLVKRPDLALMFHRQDAFVSINGFVEIDGDIVILDNADATGKSACKALGINLDNCVIWLGMPVVSKSGESFGIIGDVEINKDNGHVVSILTDNGATANTLLGSIRIPLKQILGFKRGVGTRLASIDRTNAGYISDDDSAESMGAIVVDDSVAKLQPEGGVAEKAGVATAVAADKAKRTVEKVKPKAKEAAASVQKATKNVSKSVSKGVEKGAFATGKQLGRAQGMFGRFAEEFKSAYNGEEEASDTALDKASDDD